MKTRATLVQGGLAALGLLAAYVTWQRPTERPAADVTVVDVPAERLSSVRYETGKRWVELTRAEDGVVRVTLSAVAPVYPLPPAGADAGTPDAQAQRPLVPGTPQRTLRGGEAAEALLSRMAPLRASRALGVLEEAGLKEVGLTESTQRLVLGWAGRSRAFTVSTAVLGLNSPYLRSESDGQVYLLGPGVVADLDAASARLVDRRLHAFLPGDFDAVAVVRGSSRRDFMQRTQGREGPRLFPAERPEEADTLVGTWHDRLWRSSPVELYGQGELPPGGEPKVEVRVEYAKEGRPLGFIELAPGADGRLLARSEHTLGWVALSSGAETLLAESERVVTPGVP